MVAGAPPPGATADARTTDLDRLAALTLELKDLKDLAAKQAEALAQISPMLADHDKYLHFLNDERNKAIDAMKQQGGGAAVDGTGLPQVQRQQAPAGGPPGSDAQFERAKWMMQFAQQAFGEGSGPAAAGAPFDSNRIVQQVLENALANANAGTKMMNAIADRVAGNIGSNVAKSVGGSLQFP